ncbi:MAG: hypothetical protein ACI845_000879 [Gammaproteobacteria bacterium]
MSKKENRQSEDDFDLPKRRKGTITIVIAHLLIVVAFFTATFFWGSFE